MMLFQAKYLFVFWGTPRLKEETTVVSLHRRERTSVGIQPIPFILQRSECKSSSVGWPARERACGVRLRECQSLDDHALPWAQIHPAMGSAHAGSALQRLPPPSCTELVPSKGCWLKVSHSASALRPPLSTLKACSILGFPLEQQTQER